MITKKKYLTPSSVLQFVETNNLLTSSSSHNTSSNNNESITINVKDYGFYPDAGEVVLVAHGSCKIMKDKGREIGEAFGKVHFVSQEASSQNIICCITNKRLVLIPQDNKEKAKKVFSITGSIIGVDWIAKKVAMSTIFNNWLEYSVEIKRDDIISAELSDMPVGNIVIIKLKGNKGTLFLDNSEFGYSMDIATAIHNPHIFM